MDLKIIIPLAIALTVGISFLAGYNFGLQDCAQMCGNSLDRVVEECNQNMAEAQAALDYCDSLLTKLHESLPAISKKAE